MVDPIGSFCLGVIALLGLVSLVCFLSEQFAFFHKLEHLIIYKKLLKDPLTYVRNLDYVNDSNCHNDTFIYKTIGFLKPFRPGRIFSDCGWVYSLEDLLDNPCFCKEKDALLKAFRYVLSRIENTKTASSQRGSLRYIFSELADCIDRTKHGSERDFTDYGLEIYGYKFVKSYNNFKLKNNEKTKASTMFCFENIVTFEMYTYEGWDETYEAICEWEKAYSENNSFETHSCIEVRE